jgi:hypothetical protein
VIDVGPIGQDHLPNGACVLVEAVGLDRDFLAEDQLTTSASSRYSDRHPPTRERGISESFGRRAKTQGPKDQGLWSFRASKPVVVVLVVLRWAVVPIRGVEVIRPTVP